MGSSSFGYCLIVVLFRTYHAILLVFIYSTPALSYMHISSELFNNKSVHIGFRTWIEIVPRKSYHDDSFNHTILQMFNTDKMLNVWLGEQLFIVQCDASFSFGMMNDPSHLNHVLIPIVGDMLPALPG